MSLLLPLLVAIVGLFAHLAASNVKIAEAGRLAYFAGLLVFLLQVGPRLVSFLGR